MGVKKRSPELVAMAVSIYKEFGTGSAVKTKLDVSHSTAYRLLEQGGITLPGRTETKPCRIKVKGDLADVIVKDYLSGLNWRELEDKHNVGQYSMREAVRRAGIPLRDHGGQRRRVHDYEEIEICRLYTEENFSQAQIATKLGSGQAVISRVLRKNGIKNKQNVSGENHGSWDGGRSKRKDGYILVMDNTFPTMITRIGYVLEHRLNMAKYLNRPLEKWESVHHIDGNRSNNDISNLQLRIGQHGSGVVYCCSECGTSKVKPVRI